MGGVVDSVVDFVSDAWDVVKDVVDVVADVITEVADIAKGIINTVSDIARDVVEITGKVATTINNVIKIPVIYDVNKFLIDNTVKVVTKAIDINEKAFEIVFVDTTKNIVQGVNNTVQYGSFLEIAATIVGAVATGGMSLVYQYVIPGFTGALAQHGVISETWAQVINVGAMLYGMYQGWTSIGEGSANLQGMFTSLGASASTASWLASALLTTMSIASLGMTIYGMYEAYQTAKDIENMYKTALAEWESWLHNFKMNQAKQEQTWKEGMSFADGSYYEGKLPGQLKYAIFSPSREAFVPMDVVQPAYWVENTKPPFKEDREVANMMWEVKDLEFKNKFELVPFELDTGYVGSQGVNTKNTVKYREYIEEVNKAIAQNESNILIYQDSLVQANAGIKSIDAATQDIQSSIATLNDKLLYVDKEQASMQTKYNEIQAQQADLRKILANGSALPASAYSHYANKYNENTKIMEAYSSGISSLQSSRTTITNQLTSLYDNMNTNTVSRNTLVNQINEINVNISKSTDIINQYRALL